MYDNRGVVRVSASGARSVFKGPIVSVMVGIGFDNSTNSVWFADMGGTVYKYAANGTELLTVSMTAIGSSLTLPRALGGPDSSGAVYVPVGNGASSSAVYKITSAGKRPTTCGRKCPPPCQRAALTRGRACSTRACVHPPQLSQLPSSLFAGSASAIVSTTAWDAMVTALGGTTGVASDYAVRTLAHQSGAALVLSDA